MSVGTEPETYASILENDFYGLGTIQFQIISLSPLCNMVKLNFSGLSISGWDYDVGVISILVHGVSCRNSGQV